MKMLTKRYSCQAPRVSRSGMNRPSVAETVRQRYNDTYAEMATLLQFTQLKQRPDTVTIPYALLPQTELPGFPVGSDRDAAGRLEFVFPKTMPNTHILNIGTTGSGKTTGFVEPGLRALSSKRNKPNLVLTDPKGELFARNAAHLQAQGYRLYLLNFKDVQHTDCWNPLAELYDLYTRQKELFVRREIGRGSLDDYTLCARRAAFGNEFWVCDGKAYPTEAAAQRSCQDELAAILSDTGGLVKEIVHTLIPDSLQASHDPSWFMGAQEILSGILYAMLEDALDERSGFTRDNMNLMTVREYFDCIRREVLGRGASLRQTKKLMHKPERAESLRQLASYFENANGTTRSYLGCFRNAMQGWFNCKIFTVCNGDTVRLDTEEPFAIFLTTRDFEKSDFTIAGLFIDWVYRKMLEAAERNQGSLSREMYFLLDEFANIPPIKDFENKIATARSRNIWFQIFVQSYAQLEKIYGVQNAQTIIENCNTHVFMGSQSYDTKSKFARECGKQTVPSPEASLDPRNKRMVEVPLLTVHRLETLPAGEMYVRSKGLPLILSGFLRSYQCPEFAEDELATPESMGIESLPFNAEQYRYAFLESDLPMTEFAARRDAGREKEKNARSFLFEVV